jgi:hypothetical protein
MNNSNAAAKKRRAGIQPTTPTPSNPSSSTSNPSQNINTTGLTLPQVIAVIDHRLLNLESFMKESKNLDNTILENVKIDQSNTPSNSIVMDVNEFNTFVDEINQRFQVLAEEVNGLKDALLKLQGYTMDVNKVLLNEFSKNNDLTLPNIEITSNDDIKSDEDTTENTKNI